MFQGFAFNFPPLGCGRGNTATRYPWTPAFLADDGYRGISRWNVAAGKKRTAAKIRQTRQERGDGRFKKIMKKCAGFIDDLIPEWEDTLMTQSIWDQVEDQPATVVLGLCVRRWKQVKKFARTLTEQRILEILGAGGNVGDAARELHKTERRIRQIMQSFFERVTNPQPTVGEMRIHLPAGQPLPRTNQLEMTL